MKTRTLAVVAASLLALSACKDDKAGTANAPAEAKPAAAPAAAGELSTQEQKVSYILGMNIGGQFKANQVPLDEASFIAGMKTATSGGEPKLSKEQIQQTMMTFQGEMQKKQEEAEKKQQAEQEAAAAKNKQEGDKFLAENKAKPGVQTTASGLQYEVITEGKGAKPKATESVTVNYRGTLIDGTEFDSSYKRNEPATFPVNAVIPGWIEALQLMPEGSKWKLYIPSDLAYGPGGTGGAIGPNATLIFEVELLKIEQTPSGGAVEPVDMEQDKTPEHADAKPAAESKPAAKN
jgi:FKBP-type peptidyl-prolyl cis-trans isomerase